MTDSARPTVIARTVVRTVVPIIVLTAISLLLQGHNLPGGGFIGGVLTVTAFALVYISYGSEFLSHTLLRTGNGDSGTGSSSTSVITVDTAFFSGTIGRYTLAFAVGLALAAGSGVVAIALGMPFLTQAVAFIDHVPIYKKIELASALAFDLGVYFVVVGSLLTILAVVGEQ